MSTPIGFHYLYNTGYIDREMDDWFHVCSVLPWSIDVTLTLWMQERNYHYLVQVEVYLAKAFTPRREDKDALWVKAVASDCVVFITTLPF
jgi:rapamycin-insensitive companion of mTOR